MSDKKIQISDFRDLDIWRIEADQDWFLQDYYVEIPAYSELITWTKYFIVGRKWTWKSALKETFYKKMLESNVLVSDFQFSSIFNASFFDELIVNYEEQNKSYIDLIRYVLLVRFMLLVVTDESLDLSFRSDLNKFLILNGYKVENIASLYKTIKTDSVVKISWEISFWFDLWIFNFNWKLSREDQRKQVIETDYRKILEHLTTIVFQKLNPNNHYMLLIDKIDDLWTSYFNIYDNVVLNFIKAVVEFNRGLRTTISLSTKSRVILFLREDLLNRIRWKDANFNKILQDELIKIDWQSSYEENWLLNDLINKRLKKAIILMWNNPDDFKKPLIQNALESSLIITQMMQSQFRWEDEKRTFIKRVFYNRTYLRPRDVIKYFHFLTKSMNVIDFQNQYSDYLLEELDNELNPILYDVERTKRALKKICQWGTWKFSSNDFIKIYHEITYSGMKEDDNSQVTAKDSLEHLYNYSVIWNYSEWITTRKNWNTWQLEKIHKTDYRFKYREYNKTDFDPDKMCIIHAWLYQALWVQFEE